LTSWRRSPAWTQELVQGRRASIRIGSEAAMSFHGLGVTEHEQGAKTVMLISNLAMMTGNIGRPGVGVNPLRGQNNVQGAADMGCQPHQGAGYFEMNDLDVQKRYSEFYGTQTPSEPGWKIPQMFDNRHRRQAQGALAHGRRRRCRPTRTRDHVRHAMDSLEFLVVQEIFMTETAKYRRRHPARVIVPGKERHLHQRRAPRAARERHGDAAGRHQARRPDHVRDRAALRLPAGPTTRPMACSRRSRSIVPFFKGATWENLGDQGLQWPIKEGGVRHARSMHLEQFSRGKGHFHYFDWKESQRTRQTNGKEFPFILTTGRILEHYNCGTMTSRTGNEQIVSKDLLAINPVDAKAKSINTGDTVKLFSARGEVES